MRGNLPKNAARVFAAVLSVVLLASTAIAEVNCPSLVDQTVVVPQGRPVTFRLLVSELGDGTVSIFQYPAGGILEQSGATPLDFVFVPQIDFRGTTTFTYRLTPPVGCPRSVQLGRVTLASGNAGSLAEDNATTASGVVNPPREPGLFDLVAAGLISNACGVGFAPFGMLTAIALISGRRRFASQRRAR